MRYKLLSWLFLILGFVSSIGFPLAAAVTQVNFLRAQAEISLAERVGITASGIAIGLFIVGFTLWKYISVLFREKFRSHRTLFGFWSAGYLLIIAVKCLIDSLELIFLGGVIGTVFAIVFFYLSDKCKERSRR